MTVAIAKRPLFAKNQVAHPQSRGDAVLTTQASEAL
jgi:hypothetical protein